MLGSINFLPLTVLVDPVVSKPKLKNIVESIVTLSEAGSSLDFVETYTLNLSTFTHLYPVSLA